MSDMDLENSGLQEVANAIARDDGSQKRKRDSESADDTRRGGNKRISPNNSKDHHDVEHLQDYNLHQGHMGHNGEHASTAAAALAGIYPTMTVPQPTDVSFATQGSDGDRNDSFMDNSQQDSMVYGESNVHSGRVSKPAVGSEEWHKVRKDNHKEGKLFADFWLLGNRADRK